MSNKKHTGLVRPVAGLMALEQRFMFDGAALADASATVSKSVATDAGLLQFAQGAEKTTPALDAAQQQAEKVVTAALQQPDALQQLFALFNGGQSQPSVQWSQAANALIAAVGDQSLSISVQLRSNAEMQGALGAFAAKGVDGQPVIYLNADYAKTASSDAIEAVLVEELGHAIDNLLNPGGDSPGDEGHAFASLLLTGQADLAANLARDDHRTLRIEGQSIAVEEDVGPLGIAQVNFVPLPEADIQAAQKAIVGATKVSGNVQSVVAITATTNNTVVAYDQWSDGYETNLSAPTQASTTVWIYNNGHWYNDANKNGVVDSTESVVVSGQGGITVNNQTLILSNAVDPANPAALAYDGRDKIGSSKAVTVTRAGWSTTPGTVLAGAVSVIDAGNAGTSYILPIGQNVVTAPTDVPTSRLFEYTSVDIMATVDNTTVNIDKDGNGTVDTTVVLNQGQTYMVNGGIYAGAKITSDKGITVNAIAGDVGSSYDNRWFSITPYEQWSSSYYAPVGTTLAADPAYVFVYNPSASAIKIYYDNSTSTGNFVTVAANTTQYVSMTGSAAHFYTKADSSFAKFYAVSTIDSDPTSHSTHDWSYSLVPESYLTTKFVSGWAPGVDNITRSIASTDANGSPLWVTTTASTWLYIDSATVTVKDSAGNAIAGTMVSAGTYKYSVKALESYRIFNSSKDQSGLSVYTVDGTLLTGAWGEDPSIAGAGTPYLDMGYTMQPYPEYVFTKQSIEAPNGGNAAISNGDGAIQFGEQIQYTLSAVNRSVISMYAPTFTDAWSPTGAATYVAGSAKATVYDTDGTTIINQFTLADGLNGAFPLSGGYTIADVDGNAANGVTGLARGQKIVITYNLQLPGAPTGAQLTALSSQNFQISNSANMSDQSGASLNAIDVTTITTKFTDGEVFFYDAGFTAAQSIYKPGDNIGLQVSDGDQNKSATAIETLTVKVTNNTTSEIENVVLTETGANTGIFRGTLPTNSAAAGNGNGSTLKLANGNSIKVEYTDPVTGQAFDNPANPGISGTLTTGNANVKTAAIFVSAPAPTDGLVEFYYDSAYTQKVGNYAEGDSLYLRVTDGDQNIDATKPDTLNVKVTNTTTGEVENVTLTETGNATGVFQGGLVTSNSASDGANNTGTLKAVAGDALRVDYSDPVTGALVTPTDTVANPGANANTAYAAVAKIKTLYLSADAASNDTTGDLDRISPVVTNDTTTEVTSAIGTTYSANTTPVVTVTVPPATGSDQLLTASSSSGWLAQTFVLGDTTISKVNLMLSGTASTTGSVVVRIVQATVSGSGASSTLVLGQELGRTSMLASSLSSTASLKDFVFNLTGLSSTQTYAIVLENQSSSSINWVRDTGNDTYANGNAFDNTGPINANNGNSSTRDFQFNVYNTSNVIKAQDSVSGASNVALSASTNNFAQSFSVSSNASLNDIQLSLKDTASNTGNIVVHLRTSFGGADLASATINATALGSSYSLQDFVFSSPVSLTASTTYYMVLDNQSSGSISWQYAPTNTYSGGAYIDSTGTADTTKDFVFSAYDTTNTLLSSAAVAPSVASVVSGQYAGQSFTNAGSGTYVLDKISLNLNDADNTANTGNLTLTVRSGGVTGTVLATATVDSSTLNAKSSGLGGVVFSFAANPVLTKGTQYFMVLNNGSNASIEWEKSATDIYSSQNSYSNSTTGSSADFGFKLYEATVNTSGPAVFTQAISMATPFSIPAGGDIKVVTYVDTVSGLTDGTVNVDAKLSYGSTPTTIIDMTSATYNSTDHTLTWIGQLANGVTLPADNAIKLTVTNNVSGSLFKIDYDSSTTPSRIDLPTSTVIAIADADANAANGVQQVGFYDNSFANSGSLITAGAVNAGDSVYVRVKVSDPFGYYDVNGLTLSIDGPGATGDVGVANTLTLTNSNVVASSGQYKTYEYVWQTINNPGNYNVTAVAKEGYENTITATAVGSLAVQVLDLGTPSKTEFIDSLGGPISGTTYAAGATAYLRVTDMDKSGTGQVQALVNGQSYTLVETSTPGIFEVAIPGSLSAGAILNARYVDAADGSDVSTDSISVPVPGNHAPTATDNTRSINKNQTAAGTNLISSNEGSGVDTDPDSGDVLAVVALNGAAVDQTSSSTTTSITLPSGALVTVRPDGVYSYNPNGVYDSLNGGQTATDSFTYTLSDGHGGVSTATVTVSIQGVNAPVLSVNNIAVNEGSPYAVFTVTGLANQQTGLTLASGLTNPATAGGVDYATSSGSELDYSNDGGLNWVAYNGGNVTLNSSGALLVRTVVVNDSISDNNETFRLMTTNTSGLSTYGTATIKDDGTGAVFNADGSANTTATLDDDRSVTVSSVTVNEGSPYAVFTVTGAAGQQVTLAMNSGTAIGGTTAPTDGSVDYGTNLQYWNGTAWTAYTAGAQVSLDAGGTLLVRNAIVQDSVYEGAQTYTLSATNTGGTAGTGTGTIVDDGTGTYFPDASPSGSTPATDSTHVLDDDRAVTVNSITVNEGSPYAVFTVTGAANQKVTLGVNNVTAMGGTTTPTDGSVDFNTNLQYWNGTAWTAYSAGAQVSLDAGGKLLVRNAIVNDSVYEGAQTYNLSATNTGGTAGTGTGTIVDDGTGTYFPDASPSGSTPATDGAHVLNDDRPVTVNSVTVNEGSPYAVFIVAGAANQKVTLGLTNGTAIGGTTTPTDGSVDFNTNLQYWNGTAWTAYTAGAQVSLNASGTLLVRNAIVQDSVYEGAQTYILSATNTGGTAGTGTGTIVDDGTGTYFPDASPSGSTPATDSTHVLDDDRAVTVNSITVNEGSPYAVFIVAGAANQKVTLGLTNGTAIGGTTTPTDGSVDFNTNLQYWNGTAWTAYTAGAQVTLNASGTLLVRNAIVQDNVYEGAQTYTLSATNTGGTAGTGTGTIVDDGTGTYFPDASPSGSTPATDSTHVLDDDRAVTVNSITVNEGSPYAVFIVAGAANQKVNLSLADGTAHGATINASTPTDGSVDYGTNLQYWNGTAWTAYTAGAQVSLNAGGTLLVRNAIVQDNVYEGAQTYTLSATNTGGTAGTGTGTIVDDGTGTYFPDASPSGSTPATDSTHVLDDDRAVTVSSITVNEGSPYAVFTVSGAANQKVTLGVSSVTAMGGTTTPTDGSVDYGTSLQYWNGTAWTAYSAGAQVSLDAGGKLLVRNAIVNDSVYEGAQTYTLSATNTGGTAGTGTGTIVDDGTGTYFPDANPSGSTPATDGAHVLNDDRPVTVNSVTVNEGSPYAVFTVTGAAGQQVTLAMNSGTAIGGTTAPTDGSVDYGTNLQYWNGTAWTAYTAGAQVSLNASGTLLVRNAIVQDSVYEGAQTYTLSATITGGTAGTGTGTIVDDGTGTYFPDANPNNDGTPSADSSHALDDDRAVTVSSVTVNEGSPYAVFTVTGAANQKVTLALNSGTAIGGTTTPTDGTVDFNTNLQYWNGTAWTAYTAGTLVSLDANGKLLVRNAIVQDSVYEGAQTYSLVVANTGGTAGTGTATIMDDGTGTYFPDASPSGSTPAIDSMHVLDDDRQKPAVLVTPPPPPAEVTPAPVVPTPPPPRSAPLGFASELQPVPLRATLADPPQAIGDVKTSNSGYQIPVNDSAPPGLTLYRGITDQVVQTTEAATKVSMPFDAFIHTNKDAVIKLEAKQADNSPLPKWVQFDPATGVFEVTPPKGFKGKLDLMIKARDDDGREATAMFQMFVGEQGQTLRPQSRSSFSEKLRLASKHPVTLVRVADGRLHGVAAPDARVMKVRAG